MEPSVFVLVYEGRYPCSTSETFASSKIDQVMSLPETHDQVTYVSVSKQVTPSQRLRDNVGESAVYHDIVKRWRGRQFCEDYDICGPPTTVTTQRIYKNSS